MVLDLLSPGLERFLQKCKGCESILDYGANTTFNKKVLSHTCDTCGEILE